MKEQKNGAASIAKDIDRAVKKGQLTEQDAVELVEVLDGIESTFQENKRLKRMLHAAEFSFNLIHTIFEQGEKKDGGIFLNATLTGMLTSVFVQSGIADDEDKTKK